MDNLKGNITGAYLWQPPQQSQSTLMQQSSVPPPPQQPPATPPLLNCLPQPVRRFAGNKNYNYMQSQAQAASLLMGSATPGGHLMGLGGPSDNPNGYRKRQPMPTGYSPAGYQHNGKSLFSIPENVVVLESQPPLLGPGTAFPPFGAPEYHPTQPDNWKGAAIHPTGLMKEPTGVVAGRNAPVAFAQQGQAQGAVMMVYGMDHDTSNTDKLFNLVCLYGNVARIKFLKTKEGTAMVQMGDSVAVERCVQHLNNIPVGTGGKIQIAFSKQNFLSEVINPFLLPDHTPSFKEYTGSKNNRFLSPAQASKNRIQPPSKILHFFNTPPGLTEDQLIGIFNIKEVPATSVRLFPLKTERSSSGLIEFPNISQAVLAIMKCNHLPIEGKGTKFPFIMKLCFSSSKSMNGAWNNAANEGMIEKENDGDIKVEIYN
ncbi:heterogeneous nuclear ribonucleoprotein L isoform X26 [Drosophila sulfurigaster albostrigata]|uniref:heterogeneous nuclear ribonucleoprotein L isoform X26 n=1 Tax=Drosophila sulfurigaster albostrigata TaxID=89887 RepID=UPI002D21CB1F|nr:heterogeneous nuclear ribonucleoprotein L isoform X26 [Drosophila sulfurigaster albostrigata]